MVTRNQAAILQRLETTKRFGLVSDYFVSWTGRMGEFDAKVHVWGNGAAPAQVVQDYMTRLLAGLVPERQITVAPD